MSEVDRVQARHYTGNKPSWRFGSIIKKLGRLLFSVKLDNGLIFKRHINQLRLSDVKALEPEQTQHQTVDKTPTVSQEIDQQLLYQSLALQGFVPPNDEDIIGLSASSTQQSNVETLARWVSSQVRKAAQYFADYIQH